MDFFGIGAGEILVILLVLIIVMGPEKIPGLVRTIGKTVNDFKKASGEITSQVARELEAQEKDLSETKGSIINAFSQPLETGPNTPVSPSAEKGQVLENKSRLI